MSSLDGIINTIFTLDCTIVVEDVCPFSKRVHRSLQHYYTTEIPIIVLNYPWVENTAIYVK